MFSAFGHCLRLTHAGWVLAREGVFADVDPSNLPPAARLPLRAASLIARSSSSGASNRLAKAVAKLGPSYIKLGQFLATRPDVVGAKAALELEELQDRLAPFSKALAIESIEAGLGQKIGKIFEEFGDPVAAASIAQVHRAKIRDLNGVHDVAVKVLRPGVERRFKRDLGDMFFAAKIAERYSSEARRLRLFDVVDTLARGVKMEMDFRLEAAAASEFAENTLADVDFQVPAVNWERTAKNVLVIEWIDGTSLSDLMTLKARGHDLPQLGRTVIQSFLRHAVRDGFFHADMHQGNLFIDHQGRLAPVDFGIMGRLGAKERRFLAEILFGFITRDYRRVAEVHFEAGYVPATYRVEDFAQAIRAIGEPIHSRTADQISMAKLLGLLFEITALFEMKTRTELVLLQKTMVVVEGVARSLDPKLDLWSTSEPVVASWIREKLGPAGIAHDVGRSVSALGRLAQKLPDLIEQSGALVQNLELGYQKSRSWDDIREARWRTQALRSRSIVLALWTIAAILAYIVFTR